MCECMYRSDGRCFKVWLEGGGVRGRGGGGTMYHKPIYSHHLAIIFHDKI